MSQDRLERCVMSMTPFVVSAVIAACGGGGGSSPSLESAGSLNKRLTAEDSLSTPAARNIAAASAGGASATGETSSTCGPDIGGWTTPVPTSADNRLPLRDLEQRGSRIYYVSSERGSDVTGEIYFWDGERIIDSKGSPINAAGQAYGTDPIRPSAGVRPFRRWAYVGPRDGSKQDIGSVGRVGSATPGTRAGYPDWWLFARGETFDLAVDLLSFERQANPGATNVNSSLAVPGGRSATERQVVGAYGDLCLPRPRFIHPMNGFVSRYTNQTTAVFSNVAYLSLHFDGHDRASVGTYSGITLLAQTAASTDILFEDVWVDGTTVNIGMNNAAQVTLRRVLVTDAFAMDGSHVQGAYYEGTREGRFRIEESILLRNGFARGDPKTMAWPPSGTQTWDMFNRNLYINGWTSSMHSGMFDSVSMLGASGDQFRPGMRVERNFFYQGYVLMGARGGYPDSEGPTGSIVDNVLQRFVGGGTNNDLGQPGWGLQLGGGAYGVEVANNIVTGAQYPATAYGMQLVPINQECYAPLLYATRQNSIHGNIFDSGSATAAVSIVDGATNNCYGWVYPGVRSNIVSDNVLINANARESDYAPVGAAVGTVNDTVFKRNRIFSNRRYAAVSLGWSEADRTLKSYLQSRGVIVTSRDGFPEYFTLATQQRRGQWRSDWTANSIVNYFRAGFAMVAIP
jgi:hypothetical protein